MNNIFESTEPIEDWALKHFSTLYGEVAAILCSGKQDSDDTMEAFREAMREWLHQHDHSKEVEIRALYDELHSLKQQEPKAIEGLSEKLERLAKKGYVFGLCNAQGYDCIDWVIDINNHQGYGSTPLEAVQALEEQLKEGE